MDNLNEKVSTYTFNKNAMGRVRIWSLGPGRSFDKLILDKPNLITTQGADIAARALSGLPNTSISHIYVGYNNTGSQPAVTINDTISSFTNYARIPLAFTPSYANTTGYSNNLVYFTVFVSGSCTAGPGTITVPNGYDIVELGLVNATSSNPANDYLFSHISFPSVVYNSTFGLAITWGLTFNAET
jgi:hypothetical protein